MIHQSKSYIKFLRLSKNRHGVHSPFVYNLVTKCFNDKTNYPEYDILKSHRKALRSDTSTIEMKDFGQGSRVFKGNARKVSAVLKNAGMRKKRQKLLFRLAKYFKSETILELGTSLGLGTVALSASNEFAAHPNRGRLPEYIEKRRRNILKNSTFTILKYTKSYSANFFNPEISGQKNLI